LPVGLALNAATGVISGTPTAVATSNFTAVATDTLGAAGNKPLSITINLPPTVTTASLPNWTVNQAYTATPINISNGTAPFGFSVTLGTLPAGMTLGGGTGIVGGTPTTAATSNFTVTVVDAAGASTTQAYTIIINPVPVVQTAGVPNWTVNRVYPTQTMTLTAGTGTAPFTWAITAGAQPTGLAFTAGGVLSGTPTATGPFTFTVTATDAAGATASKVFSAVTINPPPTIATALPDWTISRAYSQTLLPTAGTGTTPYTYAVTGGAQPTGLNLSAAGVLSGTPSATGAFTFTVTITDTAGATGTRTYAALNINPLPTVGTTTVPDWTIGRPYTQTLVTTAATGTAPFTWAISGGVQPTSLNLSAAGVLSGTPSATGSFTFTVTETDAAGATASQTYTAEKINPLPTIATLSVPSWTVNRAYPSTTLLTTAATGTPPFTWSISAGIQPTSLNLSAGGVLSGIPTVTGTYSFTVTATDAAGATASQAYNSVVINPPPAIATALGDWTVNRVYPTTTLLTNAATGTAPFTWAVTAGAQPTGLGFTAGGVLSGTPTATGPYTFTVTVTDTAGATGTRSYSPLTINPPPTVGTASVPDWTQGFPYTQTLLTTAATGTSPFTWAITGGAQPTSLLLSSGGVLSGTPSATGTYTFTVTVTDTAGSTGTKTYTNEAINPPLNVTTPTPMQPWTQNFAGYNQTLVATGGTGAQTWTHTLGTMPTGLLISSGGAITGTPTANGTFNFTVQVTDSVGASTTKGMSIVINNPLLITNSFPLASWTQGKNGYSQTMTATGGTGGTTFSVSPGPLPNGLSIAAGGAITGTPTVAGTYNFTVVVTDSIGASGSLGEQILINPPLNITTGGLAAWTQNLAGYSQSLAASGGTGAQTYTLSFGSLPNGLILSTGGAITGLPNTSGNFNFNVQVADTVGATAQKGFSITVNAPPAISTPSPLPDGALSTFYNQVFASTGGTGAMTWSTTTTPPNPVPGLTLSSGGSLSGTPTGGGNFPFNLTVTDSLGVSATVPMSIFILAPLTITTTDPLPGAVGGNPYSPAALAASGGRVPYSFILLSGSLPSPVSFNSAGTWSGTPPTTDNNGVYNFTVRVTDVDSRTADKPLSITLTGATSTPLAQSPATLPQATSGAAYDRAITATGGTPGYTWTAASFSPPGSGLSLGTNGHVTGMAGTPNTYTASSLVTDSTLPTPTTNTITISVTINPPLSITTLSLPAWTVTPSNPYSQAVAISNGTGPFTFSISSGGLPPGLTLNSSSGLISGGPTSAGTFAFTVQVSDNAGATANQGLQIVINPAVTVGGGTILPQWDLNFPGYNFTLFANGGTGPFTWSKTAGALPTGLSLSAGGAITGTPTATSVSGFAFTVQVQDAAGSTNTNNLNIFINQALQITSGATLPGGTENVAYNQTINLSGGSPGYNYALTGGTLPTGVALAGNSFSGTPATGSSGSYSPQVTVTDSVGATQIKTFSLTVTNAPGVLTSTPANLATNVNLDTNLILTFNMSMVKAEVVSRFSLSGLSGSRTHLYFWDTPPANPNGTTLTVALDTVDPAGVINADDLLVDNTTYTWTIASGAHSASALVMPTQTGQFQTIPDGTPPTLVSITPDPRTGVLSNVTSLVFVFSEAMNTSGSGGGNSQVQVQGGSDKRQADIGTNSGSLTVLWTNPTTLTIGLNPALTANTGYQIQLPNVSDAAGNSFQGNNQFNLLTSGSATGAPFITANYPPNGATSVNRDVGMFIGLSEPLSPDVVTKLSVTGAAVAPQIRYQLGKSDGPLGLEITPVVGWPAGTTITVTIPVTVTNASGIPLPAPFSFSFTTGTSGVGTNAIVIDDAFSSLHDAMGDWSTFGGPEGTLLFKDSVTGARVYLDDTTLVNRAISVTDPNGIPVKLLAVNGSNNNGGGGQAGQDLRISNRSGQGISNLQQGTTYTLTFQNTIAGSCGQSFAGASYTFATVPDFNTLTRVSAGFDNFNATTTLGPPNPTRTIKVQANLNNTGGGVQVQGVANASAGNTDYSTNGSVPGWIQPSAIVAVSGCSQSVNNGTFTVVSVTGSGPTTVTLNNAGGVLESSPPANASIGAPYAIGLSDITGSGNTFANFLQPNNGQYQYKSSGNESTIITDGDHTFQYTVTDGVAAHNLQVDVPAYFFTAADMSAITLTATSPPGGLNPTYSWSGTTPATASALFVSVMDNSGNSLFGWIIPPSSTSFTQPPNFPLTAGQSYVWTLGFFHSGDGTIRDAGGSNGQLNPIPFSR